MAKKEKKKEKKKGGGKFKIILFMIVCFALSIFLKAAFMFVFLGMLPTLAASIADTSKARELYRTVLACNLAGLLPYAADIFASRGHGIDDYGNLTNSSIWLVVYAAAGAGWLLVWGCPYLVELVVDVMNTSRISRLEGIQRQLVDEWGPEIQRKAG